MIYFTSDWHINHKNVIKYCNRPFSSISEMNETIIMNYNSVVTPEDTVYFLGDFAFCSIEKQKEIFSLLNGKKYLFLGNHDRTELAMKKVGFLEVYKEQDFIFDDIAFRVSHYPFAPYDHSEHSVRYRGRRPSRENCSWLLHGHCHEKWKVNENMINVGVDVWNFFPVPLNEILKITKNKVS